jgi:DNA modification methylase
MKRIIVKNPNNLPCIEHDKLTVLQGDLKTLSEEDRVKLCHSIEKHGYFVPAFIWKSDGKHYILDATQRYHTLKWMKEEGYAIPPIPYVEIEAEDKKDAAEKLLQITSRYGKINPESTFLVDFGRKLEDIEVAIPELELQLDDPQEPEDVEEKPHTLFDKFIIPPFSVLDTRQGYWQDRKRAWIGLGIASEMGRKDELTFNTDSIGHIDFYAQKRKWEAEHKRKLSAEEWRVIIKKKTEESQRGHTCASNKLMDIKGGFCRNLRTSSIFDPVLTELSYKWFCTENGAVLDPFAGGSVRGIVAAYLGYSYTGIELRSEQVEENNKQWSDIRSKNDNLNDNSNDNQYKEVKMSRKWLDHKFICNAEYIREECHGRCCEGTDKILISLLPEEVKAIEAEGYEVKEGMLQPNIATGKCPLKTKEGLCSAHNTDLKPFGCIASPFTLNENDTLIIRKRYASMKCHDKEGDRAYITFKASLDLIFGEQESTRIRKEMSIQSGDFTAKMPIDSYNTLKYLDGLKHKPVENKEGAINWVTGDAEDVKDIVGDKRFNFILSCPPYYDLEVYSDLPGELSATKTYEQFIGHYHSIINKAVSVLKEDRFACFVVGDIRDKKGFYRNFVSDTIEGFERAGMTLYNEAILVNVVGSLPIRITKSFGSYRKLGKCHQNVLVFYKGDIKKIKDNFNKIVVEELMPQDAPKTS